MFQKDKKKIYFVPPPLCVEMGFYADISWESRCNIEINVWAHFYKILLVFEVPYQPQVKGMTLISLLRLDS